LARLRKKGSRGSLPDVQNQSGMMIRGNPGFLSKKKRAGMNESVERRPVFRNKRDESYGRSKLLKTKENRQRGILRKR